MLLYKCDRCGKLIEEHKDLHKDLYQITIGQYYSDTKNVYDICEKCFSDYTKDFKSGKILVD